MTVMQYKWFKEELSIHKVENLILFNIPMPANMQNDLKAGKIQGEKNQLQKLETKPKTKQTNKQTEVDNFLRHWNVKADLPKMELTHCCSKTSIYAIFACTIIRSNTGYRLVISIFCRCRSGPNFPFTTASDTFPSSLNVRSKSLNLCTFEISL